MMRRYLAATVLPPQTGSRPVVPARHMRAAVLAAPGICRIERISRPKPGRDQVLIRVAMQRSQQST